MAYMSMRDYRSLPWHIQQPLGRNPSTHRSMKDYRNQWMGAPPCSVSPTNVPFDNTYNPSWGNHTNSSWEPRPPQYALPPHPQYASSSQPQPPQPISPVEQAILDLTMLVGDFVEEQKTFNAKISQRIHTVENSLDQKLDVLQSDLDQKINNLEDFISMLTNQQHVHSEEENPEEVYLSDTMVEERCTLMTEEINGKEAVEEPKKHVLKPFPTELNPTANAQATNNPLPVNILPTPAPHATPETPPAKAIPFTLPALQNLRKLVATVQAFATTSKTLAATHIEWHSGWFGCWFGFGASEPRHF